MKFFLLLLISLPAFSAVKLGVSFYAHSIKQGEIVPAKIVLEADAVQRFGLQQFKGQTFAETLYFYDVSPVIRREGQVDYEADVRLIFVKVPEGHELTQKIGNEDVTLSWGEVSIQATEAAPHLLFGSFEIPKESRFLLLIGGFFLFLLALTWPILSFRKKFLAKRAHKKRLLEMKSQILGCQSYDEVVELWKKKQTYFETYPHVRGPFLDFEQVLNKYQFRPSRSENDLNEIMDSYRSFKGKIEGGFNGI